MKTKNEQRKIRQNRIRAKVAGTSTRPRISIFRSNRFLSAQLIDDVNGRTLVAVSTKNTPGKRPIERARAIGKVLAEEAKKLKVNHAAFDRGGYSYGGAVRACAEGAREGGLTF